MIEAYLAKWLDAAPVLLGSAAVVALMVGVAYVLGFRSAARLDEAALARLAAGEGDRVAAALVAPDGRSAFARLASGKVMVARVMGDDISARIAAASGVRATLRGGMLSVRFADTGYPPLTMPAPEPPAWLAELAAGDAR
ncbi:MAG: hypothetical protein AB7Q23_09810 [Hyphomonadaceae bacterium]